MPYYKAPGWPLGFGEHAKAKELLLTALASNPREIDPNFFYGEYLVETSTPRWHWCSLSVQCSFALGLQRLAHQHPLLMLIQTAVTRERGQPSI